MDIMKRKGQNRAFLCVKAYRDPLHDADIIHRTLLVKVRQRNMAAGLVDPGGRSTSSTTLNQSNQRSQIDGLALSDRIA